MAARIPTRVKALVDKIDPLASWMKVNKPEATSLHITHKDWLFLLQSPINSIRIAGFNVTSEKGLTYRGFTLKPIKVIAERGPNEDMG